MNFSTLLLAASATDAVNDAASHINAAELYGAVQQHSLMVSIKEIFGLLAIAGLFAATALALNAAARKDRP